MQFRKIWVFCVIFIKYEEVVVENVIATNPNYICNILLNTFTSSTCCIYIEYGSNVTIVTKVELWPLTQKKNKKVSRICPPNNSILLHGVFNYAF